MNPRQLLCGRNPKATLEFTTMLLMGERGDVDLREAIRCYELCPREEADAPQDEIQVVRLFRVPAAGCLMRQVFAPLWRVACYREE
jgi:hypothetical protein